MSDKPIYSLERLTKAYDIKKPVLKDVSLTFLDGAKIGVIGSNGAGKSTLLRIMAGVDKEYDGVARPRDGLTIGYVPQEPKLAEDLTVRENVELAVRPIRALLENHDQLNEKLAGDLSPEEMEKVLDELGRVQSEIEHKDAWELDRHVETAMTKLHLPPADAMVRECSGGERRRVALCRTLLEHPDLLLLDEPTNHLDAETVAWLEQTLKDYTGSVIMITHDRMFLDRVVDWMLEIFHARAIPYKGNYSTYLEQKAKLMEQQETSERKRGKFLERELEWIRMNPAARTAKNKARVKNYERMVAEGFEEKEGSIDLHIPPGKRLGDLVLRFQKVNFSYGDNQVVRDLSFDLQPGDILGIVGPNGTGKTTTLKLITGRLKPDSGTVTVGPTVELCHVDQERETLDSDKTVWQEISGGHDFLKLGKVEVNSRSYVAKFNFTGSDQQQKVGTLSGGQRNRVQLAKMLARGGNLILLDEPTNDLDLDTLRVLEEGIQNFPGCMVVVSHDRYFLDRICSRIIDLGNYEPGHYLDSL
ncbi:MAG: energy-dependent translational throttle protein EttA [Planctomycetes bacterium]|nr:energy-dependent translational throttle protein EttA [Planctomycetota bacterium]MCB9888165.1 energy-dependent translational throttle protein EttA [Planctomycetota bacterium]